MIHFEDYLINKKLKSTVFIQSRTFVIEYELRIKNVGSVNLFFLSFIQDVILIKGGRKNLYC